MKAYVIATGCTSVESLKRVARPEPQAGPREVVIRVRATSLNYRDHLVMTGAYFGKPMDRDLVPLSDGAGEVASVGAEVKRFKVGDRVAGTFFQTWVDGPLGWSRPALGGTQDGMLAEFVALHEDGVVAAPPGLSFEEAAALPCAGVTAWHALMDSGARVKAGDTVLCLGTGGVSMFAVQFAKLAGARVIITSSSDEKIARARTLGAAEGINYKQNPDWEKAVRALTGGRGVDHIVEVGGVGTLARSFKALAFGGEIALIGVLAGSKGDANPVSLMMKGGSLHGIYVGSTAMFEEMNRAISLNGIKPLVDKVFAFEQAGDAYRCMASGEFMGKIVITV
jgi:NADPH:quinone reductase-like Zn-dependent oxidoreductase